jgi:deaminated glutathione amidase
MRIALGQMLATAVKSENLDTITEMIGEAAAAGADLVAFPEAAMAWVEPGHSPAAAAESLDGPFVAALKEAARASRIVVVAGVIEAISNSKKAFNTAVAIDSTGSLIGRYHKIHMFDAFGYRESEQNQAGEGDLLLFDVKGIKVGLATCYDVRFPELYRQLAEQGAELIVQPTSWAHGLLKEYQWNVLVKARAIENTVYIAAPDQLRSAGSMVVDPMGVAIAVRGETEGILLAEVTAERIAEVRHTLPSLRHVRHDIYEQWRLVPQPIG